MEQFYSNKLIIFHSLVVKGVSPLVKKCFLRDATIIEKKDSAMTTEEFSCKLPCCNNCGKTLYKAFL